ncbi:carbohydrate-binding module family 50 protein [Plicaturopsis crispa FD-325 SS-3]|nr:carbohydrate-binding module family 50 protein [Plicaturopsis crispa FD-325 SS-3]
MGRWTQYDEDEYRLPSGMKRVGYDADTSQYFFRDTSDGSLWRGAQGAEFGEMTKVEDGRGPIGSVEEEGNDLEGAPRRGDGYSPLATDLRSPARYMTGGNGAAYRTMFPFFLIICVVLLLVWRLVVYPSFVPSRPPPSPCPDSSTPYRIHAGDTCWEISRAHGVKLEQFMAANVGLECDRLAVGARVCVPPP